MEQEKQGEQILSVVGKAAKSLWLFTSTHFDKDGKTIKQEKVLMSSAQISKIRIAHCYGQNLYNFRHGKIIRLELNDASIEYKLTRPNTKGDT